jgi:hypothetical protein
VIVYESDDDRLREAHTAEALREAWQLQLLRLPRLSSIDYIAVRKEKVIALVELKRRNVAHDHYETFMLSKRKVDDLIDSANSFKIEALIAIEFTDGIYWIDGHVMSQQAVRVGGRYDRPDGVEDTYHLPHKMLRGL